MSFDTPALTPELVPMAASGLSTLLLLVVGIVLFIFLIQRPMKKQQQAQRALQDSVAEGGRVMLTSGMFGTVRHLGDKQAIVELAPGLEVTVLRQAIAKTVAPDDEEFEYADEAGTEYADEPSALPETEDAAALPHEEIAAPGSDQTGDVAPGSATFEEPSGDSERPSSI
ncbi:MAG TPA: preprotein translocase subunit YajC [Propionibacteriaceae bacterium]|nr:preprotein translocase subunit YajC [Propionibacteriaceae bacterium]